MNVRSESGQILGNLSSPVSRSQGFSGIRFVFLDRDGIINRKPPDGQYVTTPTEFVMLPGVAQALSTLKQSGRKTILVTNQRAIALGLLTEQELAEIHRKLQDKLREFGTEIDLMYYCPHDLDQCDCRKPGGGMFQRAFSVFPEATPANSVMIGDSESDIIAGMNLGMRTIYVEASNSSPAAMATASATSLLEAVTTFLID